ncbi:MAG: hypothetical protein A2Y07_08745 [Planctomycetes bacterium GWF2_50_10]|nr:MAG: hypothetical protein A2Y07_08745 [Planctomycetes bacterium GWF2_50_10]
MEVFKSYAVTESGSKGRKFAQAGHSYRNAFERDRDRIIHCDAFRRLAGKTQVFAPGLDDNYRSRSTHTIEVAQVGRTIARVLGINETLTEAICLAHDLGHSPFGHSGEMVLNKISASFGGFEHNRQTLRIVDLLEHPYVEFAGLNLMYETRLGLAKHRSPYDRPEEHREFNEAVGPLEAQAADIADRIAYNAHDFEDASRAGLLDVEQLATIEIYNIAAARCKAELIEDASIRKTRIAKAIIDTLVSDVIETSKEAIAQSKVASLADVYGRGEVLVRLSEKADEQLRVFEKLLMDNVYMHPKLRSLHEQVEEWLMTLYDLLRDRPEMMAVRYRELVKTQGLERTVVDYIAGMTDRFCIQLVEENI